MAPAIPRVVHRIWIGPHPLPDVYREHADDWRRYGYDVVDWDEQAILAEGIINRAAWDAAVDADPGAGLKTVATWVQRADIISYEILWRHGGIYANTDIRPLRDLHQLLGGVDAFVVNEHGVWASNALMGCTPGHPFYKAVVDELPKRTGNGRPMNEQTGPHLLTHVAGIWRDLVTTLDPDPFFPYLFGDMHLEGRPDLWPPGDWWVEHRWGHRHPELLTDG